MTEIQQLVQKLANQLTHRDWTLSTAESCTGGGIATTCTDLGGSSSWFDCGFITYSNRAKSRLLDIPPQLIEQFGAVSEQTVLAMVNGALANSDADIAVAVSGVAGPSGGSEEKPVGTVWIAWGDKISKQTQSKRYLFAGDRSAVRQQTIVAAMHQLITWTALN